MSTNVDEVKKSCEANILSLPSQVLLKIFKKSTQDIRDVISVNKVCKQFSKVAQSPVLYTDVKIVENNCVEDAIKLLKENEEVVRKFEVQNVSDKSVNALLAVVRNLQLTSLKIKNVNLSDSEILMIKEIFENCETLRSFKIVNVQTFGSLQINELWLQILRTASSRPMEEFSFLLEIPFIRYGEWDMNSFFETSKSTLKLLKIATPQYGFKIGTLAECNRLKKFHLVIVMPSAISRTWAVRSRSLKMLTSIKIEVISKPDEASLLSLLSKQHYVNLKEIEINGLQGFRGYCKKILETIATNAPNTEELNIHGFKVYFINASLSQTVLKLMAGKILKKITFPAMMLSDLLEIDKELNTGNYTLIGFKTAIFIPSITERSESENKLARGELTFDNFIADLPNNEFVAVKMKTEI